MKTINELVRELENQYYNRADYQRQDFQKILEVFVNSMENPREYNRIKKIFLKIDSPKKKPIKKQLTVSNIRQFLFKSKSVPNEYKAQIEKFIWRILPELSSFNNNSELNNFLSYILEVRIEKLPEIEDRKKLVKIYKDLYDSLDESKKEMVLQELARRVISESRTEELVEFSKYFKK
jgi:hypothetical protein